MKRLFIAIPFIATRETLDELNELKYQFRRDSISWVKPENLHFTLQFLGNTKEETIPVVSEILQKTTQDFSKTTGLIKGLNYFSQKGYPKVIYSETKGISQLEEMATRINTAIEPMGYSPDHKKFKSHLTFGRIKELNDVIHFKRIIEAFKEKPFQKFDISEVILFQSILTQEGPIYKPLEKFDLK